MLSAISSKKIKDEKEMSVVFRMWRFICQIKEFRFHYPRRRKVTYILSSFLTGWAWWWKGRAYCEKSAVMDWIGCFRFVSCIMELIAFTILLLVLKVKKEKLLNPCSAIKYILLIITEMKNLESLETYICLTVVNGS